MLFYSLSLLWNAVQLGFQLEPRILIRSNISRTCLLGCLSDAVCGSERLYGFIDRGCFYWCQSMFLTSLLLWWLWWLLSQRQWSLRGLDKIYMLHILQHGLYNNEALHYWSTASPTFQRVTSSQDKGCPL